MLLSTSASALRPRLDAWLRQHALAPTIAAEFDDSALLKAFGHARLAALADTRPALCLHCSGRPCGLPAPCNSALQSTWFCYVLNSYKRLFSKR